MSLSLSRFGFGGQKTTARKYHKFWEGSWLSVSLSHSHYSITISSISISITVSLSESAKSKMFISGQGICNYSDINCVLIIIFTIIKLKDRSVEEKPVGSNLSKFFHIINNIIILM